MQRFTLIHDGSNQSWQAAYLAFQIAARLGAPLLALLVDTAADSKNLTQRAAQVEVGGRAAELSIKIRFVTDPSVKALADNAAGSNGLFIPRRIIPDGETASRFLEVLSCPVWIVSKNEELREMAVLVDDLDSNRSLIDFTTTLSSRIQLPLTGLIPSNQFAQIPKNGDPINWLPLDDMSQQAIAIAIKGRNASLLFLPASNVSLLSKLSMNCVVFPAVPDA